jgi:hypothetical protein
MVTRDNLCLIGQGHLIEGTRKLFKGYSGPNIITQIWWDVEKPHFKIIMLNNVYFYEFFFRNVTLKVIINQNADVVGRARVDSVVGRFITVYVVNCKGLPSCQI